MVIIYDDHFGFIWNTDYFNIENKWMWFTTLTLKKITHDHLIICGKRKHLIKSTSIHDKNAGQT